MKQRIIEIIDELRKVIKQQEMNISDDTLFSEALSTYRGEMAGMSKKTAQKPIYEELDALQKPTQKQIDFLKKHQVKIPKTKQEATLMIKNYIENQKEV